MRTYKSEGILRACRNHSKFFSWIKIARHLHSSNQWGHIDEKQKQQNENAPFSGEQILSFYKFPENLIGLEVGYKEKPISEDDGIVIVTEKVNSNGKRTSTVVMFSQELNIWQESQSMKGLEKEFFEFFSKKKIKSKHKK